MSYIYPVESLAILDAVVKLSIETPFQNKLFDKMLARYHRIFPVQNEKMFFDRLFKWFLNFLLVYKIKLLDVISIKLESETLFEYFQSFFLFEREFFHLFGSIDVRALCASSQHVI